MGEDNGHGKAWRVDVRTVNASGLWRQQPSSKRTAPGEPEGICPNGAEQGRRRDEVFRPPGDAGQHVGGEQGEKRKESPSVLHHALGEESISSSDQVTGVGSP